MLKKGQFKTVKEGDALFLRDGRCGKVITEPRIAADGADYVVVQFVTYQCVIDADVKKVEVDGYQDLPTV